MKQSPSQLKKPSHGKTKDNYAAWKWVNWFNKWQARSTAILQQIEYEIDAQK